MEVLAAPVADPSTGNGPSALLARMILDQAMSRLKPEDRLVITLFELEDRSVREVAEMTGWSESRVKVRAIVTETRREIVEIRKPVQSQVEAAFERSRVRVRAILRPDQQPKYDRIQAERRKRRERPE